MLSSFLLVAIVFVLMLDALEEMAIELVLMLFWFVEIEPTLLAIAYELSAIFSSFLDTSSLISLFYAVLELIALELY